jgi:hypothetical protein
MAGFATPSITGRASASKSTPAAGRMTTGSVNVDMSMPARALRGVADRLLAVLMAMQQGRGARGGEQRWRGLVLRALSD